MKVERKTTTKNTLTIDPLLVFTVCFEFRVEFNVVVANFFLIIMITISIFHSVGMCNVTECEQRRPFNQLEK